MHNVEIARRLDEVADLLEAQRANAFRVQAYRRVAAAVRHLPKPLSEIWEEKGEEGLHSVTGAGERLATALRTLVTTGRLPMLDRLRGESDPVELLESVPGIGRSLAERLHGELGIDSLEDLEAAAHDGRLSDLAGIGPKKLAGIQDTLASRLGRIRHPVYASDAQHEEPSVGEMLDVDQEYREKAGSGALPTIAPRRFNPKGAAWLPILHTSRGERNYTALFSNTARAHEFGMTHDWVVLYCDGGLDEKQVTVITSHRGSLAGKRIVRGREQDCELYYQQAASAPESHHTGPG